MPNLEYSVRFVLASDSTTQIDQALAKMRETGSTITVKVNADASGFDAEMKKVNAEIQKVEASTEKLSRSTSKGSGLFKMYGKEIRSALNEFRATRDLDKAQATFADISARVGDFGNSMKDSAQGMQEFYTLTNQITSATATLNRENNNSAGVIKAREMAERALNEETKKSAQILARRARASKFDSDQAKAANTAMANSVRGVVTELRLLSNSGTATAEQLQRLFGRTMTSAKDTQVTTMDLSKAFSQQKAIVEASAAPYHQRMALLKQIRNEEQLAAGQMRNVNRTLGQQENQVGDVSYAMVSFTRLLEDMPYGFRGFANNIQPTIYGLIQLNGVTDGVARRFRGIHKREMPLMGRAMLNLKSALSSPINQLLLLSSVIAVAGTMIERWAQSARKANKEASDLSQGFLNVFDAIKGQDVLDTDYDRPIEGLELYSNALQTILDLEDKRIETLERNEALRRGMDPTSFALSSGSMELLNNDEKRLEITRGLSEEAKKKITAMKAELEVQKVLLQSEEARYAIYLAQLRSRDATAAQQVSELQDQLQIERVRIAQGDEAAIREKARLAIERLRSDNLATDNDEKLINLQLEMELLQLSERRKKSAKEIADEAEGIKEEYEGMALALRRQLEDEQVMSLSQLSNLAKTREIEDTRLAVSQRRIAGEKISAEQEKALIDLIEQRYNLIDERQREASALAVQDLQDQVTILGKEGEILDALLRGDYERATQLEFATDELEYQNQLKKVSQELTRDQFASDEDLNKAIEARTKALEKEYQIKQKSRAQSAREDVAQFLAPELSPIERIRDAAHKARIASDYSFMAQRASIEQQYADDAVGREQALTDMYARQEAERKAIALKGTTAIQDIKSKGYIEGSMVIVGALEQLNQSSEATSKKAFERQKAISAGLATINTLLGITQVLSDKNIPSTFLKYAQAAALAAIGFAQVRKIRSARYGGSTSGGSIGGTQSQGFREVDLTQNATSGVAGTMAQQPIRPQITVIGNVDREGIAFAVRDGEDSIASRATFAT